MTRRPPYFFVYKGRLPLGMICNVVPKHMLRSATLKECRYKNDIRTIVLYIDVHSISIRFEHFSRCSSKRSQWFERREFVSYYNSQKLKSFTGPSVAFQAVSVSKKVFKSYRKQVYTLLHTRLIIIIKGLLIRFLVIYIYV